MEGGEEQIKPKSLLALRPAKMVLGRGGGGGLRKKRRKPRKGRGTKYGIDTVAQPRGACVRESRSGPGR